MPEDASRDVAAVATLLAMVSQLERGDLAELERAMRLELVPQPTAAERRSNELGRLASILNPLPLPPYLTFPVIERELYDERRSGGDPLSARLIERFGSWRRACYHAYGLLEDGRSRGPGNPWPMPLRGKTMPLPYERHEIRAAIRACALALCVRPSSSTFFDWVAAKRSRALARGLILRLPTKRSVYAHYPAEIGGWNAALEDAQITDEELDLAWADRLGIEPEDVYALTPADVLGALSTEELRASGLSGPAIRLLRRKQPSELPLPQAVDLAVWVGASLAWLAGLTRKMGEAPAAGSTLSTALLVERRRELDLPEASVRKAARLQLGPYRRTLSGKRTPTLVECAAFAGVLRLDLAQLITPPEAQAG